MINLENIKKISDHELADCIFLILEKLDKKISTSQQYIDKCQENSSTKEGYLKMLYKDLNLNKSSRDFLAELISRFTNQPISISNEVWHLAIQDAKIRGRPGSFGFQILIEDYSITHINILPNERPTK